MEVSHSCADSSSMPRSEEHTSELQSLRHLVCRLLLEKKTTDTPRRTQAHVYVPPVPWADGSRRLRDPERRRKVTVARLAGPRLPRPPCFFFFNDTATTEIYTLSLHDALPICIPLTSAGLLMEAAEAFLRP